MKQVLKTSQGWPVEPVLMAFLETRNYAGNLRELRQLVNRLAARHVGSGPFSIGDLAETDRLIGHFSKNPMEEQPFTEAVFRAVKQGRDLKEMVAQLSTTAKDMAIQNAGGNLQAAANQLGLTDRTMQGHAARFRNSDYGMRIENHPTICINP